MAKTNQTDGRKNNGRKPGQPNTNTGILRDMILTALSDEGGVDYLRALAQHEPRAFAGLLGKVLPMQVTGEGGTALAIQVITGIPQAPGTDGDDG